MSEPTRYHAHDEYVYPQTNGDYVSFEDYQKVSLRLQQIIELVNKNVGTSFVDKDFSEWTISECANFVAGYWRYYADQMAKAIRDVKDIRLSPLTYDGENNDEVDAYHAGYNAALEDVRSHIDFLDIPSAD